MAKPAAAPKFEAIKGGKDENVVEAPFPAEWKPPSWFKAARKKVWDRSIRALRDGDRLSLQHYDTLVMYCCKWCDWEDAARKEQKTNAADTMELRRLGSILFGYDEGSLHHKKGGNRFGKNRARRRS